MNKKSFQTMGEIISKTKIANVSKTSEGKIECTVKIGDLVYEDLLIIKDEPIIITFNVYPAFTPEDSLSQMIAHARYLLAIAAFIKALGSNVKRDGEYYPKDEDLLYDVIILPNNRLYKYITDKCLETLRNQKP